MRPSGIRGRTDDVGVKERELQRTYCKRHVKVVKSYEIRTIVDVVLTSLTRLGPGSSVRNR